MLDCIESTTEELLNGVKELACGMEGKALLRKSNKSFKEFSMWVQEAASHGAGQLFRWLKDEARGEVLQFDFKEGATVEPAKFMERVHDEWAVLWLQSGHVDDLEEERLDRQISELRGAIQKLKTEHGDSLGTMETWQIDKAAAKAKANTGRGVDQISIGFPSDFHRMSIRFP